MMLFKHLMSRCSMVIFFFLFSVGITCPRLAALINGQVTQPTGSPEYGSQATFTCNSGYRYHVNNLIDITLISYTTVLFLKGHDPIV